MNILVLGAGGNAGINFIKCLKLSHHPITVHGADMNKYYRIAGNADHWADLDYTSPEKKLESLQRYVEQRGINMIHAQPDQEVEFLLTHRIELLRQIFNHSLDAFKVFQDKLSCQKKWGPLFNGFLVWGLDEVVANPLLFEELREKAGSGPVWIRAIMGAGSRCALPVQTLEEAIHWADYWKVRKSMKYNDFMICEYLPGPEYAVQTFWVDGHLIQSQARQRLIPFFGALMPSGQSSTPAVAKTVKSKEVYKAAYKAITTLQSVPHGIYCVDLKSDQEGRIMPTEVNYGRFFTTSDFFARLDVNTPLAYVENHLLGARTKRIETIRDEWYWIRGLDKEPYLFNNNNHL